MSELKEPPPVLLVMAVIHLRGRELEPLFARLEAEFGSINEISPPFPFEHTDYYFDEMGGPLDKVFIRFAKLVPRGSLPEIKKKTCDIEKEFSLSGARIYNIDPGLLSLENFVLATGKNFQHRIYLRDGVFADLTLIYHSGSFRPLPWTYPDYRDEQVISLLNRWRSEYRLLLRQRRRYAA